MNTNGKNPNIWKHWWKLKMTLGWRMARDVLPTRADFCRRNVITDNSCLFCSNHEETLTHIFQDCHMPRALWLALLGIQVEIVHWNNPEDIIQWILNLYTSGRNNGCYLAVSTMAMLYGGTKIKCFMVKEVME